MVRFTGTRIGHRVGGFYASTPLTGRNAGRQVRVGHRLPGGFRGSATLTTGARKPAPKVGVGWFALRPWTPESRAALVVIVLLVVSVIGLVSGMWPLTLLAVSVLACLIQKGRAKVHK